jgi:hypothetical protein
MASPLSTHFTLDGPLEASALARAREQLAALGVTRLDDADGVMVLVTYDASRIAYHVLAAKLRSFGIPVS